MGSSPGFLDLPARDDKPRSRGITHVLDKGLPVPELEARLSQAGHLVDVLKIGWGISYVDPTVAERIERCRAAGVTVCLGGTLLEVAAAQDRVGMLRDWATSIGVQAVEVSNGLQALSSADKAGLVRDLSSDFVVLAETGAKDGAVPVVVEQWLAELERDLDAGARWVIAEGRESGTVGIYLPDGKVRDNLVESIAERIPLDRIIFEAPTKAQQTWFIRRFGAGVNLGNVALEEVLPVETLRLGLRADTALTSLSGKADATTFAAAGERR